MMRVYISILHLGGSGSMPTLFKFTPDSAELALNYLVPQLYFFELVSSYRTPIKHNQLGCPRETFPENHIQSFTCQSCIVTEQLVPLVLLALQNCCLSEQVMPQFFLVISMHFHLGSFQFRGAFSGQRAVTIECLLMSGCVQGRELTESVSKKP